MYPPETQLRLLMFPETVEPSKLFVLIFCGCHAVSML